MYVTPEEISVEHKDSFIHFKVAGKYIGTMDKLLGFWSFRFWDCVKVSVDPETGEESSDYESWLMPGGLGEDAAIAAVKARIVERLVSDPHVLTELSNES